MTPNEVQLGGLGVPWAALCWLWVVLGVGWNFDGFEDPPWTNQGTGNTGDGWLNTAPGPLLADWKTVIGRNPSQPGGP